MITLTSQHPAIVNETIKVTQELGTGSGGTRNISGTSSYHADLERTLAELHKKDSALIFLRLTQPINLLYGPCAKN